MSSTPFFISTPRIQTAVTTGTSSRLGGTATTTRLFVSNPITGSKLESISVFQAASSSTFNANGIRFGVWLCDAIGANPTILREWFWLGNQATNPAASNVGNSYTFNFVNGMYLGTNSSIYVGNITYNGTFEALHWIAFGADL